LSDEDCDVIIRILDCSGKGNTKESEAEKAIAKNEADKIQQAIKRSGLKKPDWARNALVQAAES